MALWSGAVGRIAEEVEGEVDAEECRRHRATAAAAAADDEDVKGPGSVLFV